MSTNETSLTLIPHPQESFSDGFEGPKKLEIWFSEGLIGNGLGLKSISGEDWGNMLIHVGCKVLSIVRTANIDAYNLGYLLIS